MVGHRRVAVVTAALLLAFMVPALAPPGAARAADANPAVWPTSISGSAVGRDGGSLAGGSVTACSVGGFGCHTAFISGAGTYSMGVAAGSYQVSISPPAPYASGYYAAWDIYGFTVNQSQASTVVVTTVDVSLLTMYVPRGFVPPPPPSWGSISGYVVGAFSGSLAGGTVTACSTSWSCTSATIGSDGSYWIGALGPASYTVSITPPSFSPYVSGWYSSFSPGNFSTSSGAATSVPVWNANVALPTIVVPGFGPSHGSISGFVVSAFSGSLAGGTVTACDTSWSWICSSATIAWDGSYWIGTLPTGSYLVSVTPPTSSWVAGWYAAGWSGNFTTNASSATPVNVWSSNVSLPTIVVPGFVPAPTWGSLSGYAVGSTSGALAGGSVTACSVSWSCVSTTIGSNGWYSIGSLRSGSYTVMVAPLSNAGYQAGYYAAGWTGNFTTSSSSATAVSVWSTGVTVPTITVPTTVPPNTGGIVVTTPQAYIVWAYLRPEFSTGTSTSLRIAPGARAELASQIDPKLAGMRVEVWRRLAGKSWVLITTRGISGEGWVIYRFTATPGVAGAQFRFHLPATSFTLSVWSVARMVRLS